MPRPKLEEVIVFAGLFQLAGYSPSLKTRKELKPEAEAEIVDKCC